jgi:hypothetical protein
MADDFYDTLGIPREASESDIKSAYRKLAMKYHPDRNQGDASAEQKFKDVSQAYEILKDPKKKNKHTISLVMLLLNKEAEAKGVSVNKVLGVFLISLKIFLVPLEKAVKEKVEEMIFAMMSRLI